MKNVLDFIFLFSHIMHYFFYIYASLAEAQRKPKQKRKWQFLFCGFFYTNFTETNVVVIAKPVAKCEQAGNAFQPIVTRLGPNPVWKEGPSNPEDPDVFKFIEGYQPVVFFLQYVLYCVYKIILTKIRKYIINYQWFNA